MILLADVTVNNWSTENNVPRIKMDIVLGFISCKSISAPGSFWKVVAHANAISLMCSIAVISQKWKGATANLIIKSMLIIIPWYPASSKSPKIMPANSCTMKYLSRELSSVCLIYARNKTDIINKAPHHNRTALVDKMMMTLIISMRHIILMIRDIYGLLIECWEFSYFV